jgi:hypothetical protein
MKMRARFRLLLAPGLGVGAVTGVAVKHIPPAMWMGVIIGLITVLLTKIVSKN